MIRVQHQDFDPGKELQDLTSNNKNIGGLASFVGLVREFSNDQKLDSMTLEHYPSMTEKMLLAIESKALDQWPLDASLIIHRYGCLNPGGRIVMVATASSHRQAALESCTFLIDWLKTEAPFWKLEKYKGIETYEWVKPTSKDIQKTKRWKSR